MCAGSPTWRTPASIPANHRPCVGGPAAQTPTTPNRRKTVHRTRSGDRLRAEWVCLVLSVCADRLAARIGLLGVLRHGDSVAGRRDPLGGRRQRLRSRRGITAASAAAVALPRGPWARRSWLPVASGGAAPGTDLRRRRGD